MKHFALLCVAVVVFAAACGGRNIEAGPGPDDDDGAAAGGMAAAGGAGGDAGSAQGGNAEGGGSEGGAGEGGAPPTPIDCISCAAQQCPAALQCITDPDCSQGLICAVSQCLDGGQPDFMCLSDCFDGDFEAAQAAFAAIICITTSCGDECGGFLPF